MRLGMAYRLGLVIGASAFGVCGCTASKVDFSTIKQPARAAEFDAYETFVGNWTWEAEMHNAADANKKLTGTADWAWALDKRCLRGNMTSKSGSASFDASGVWSWHPKSKKYIWWMFNNWGYPQQGTARYDAAKQSWKMDYESVGLDGTASHGVYEMRVVDKDNLEWRADEWTDALHTVKKLEMAGTYKRKK